MAEKVTEMLLKVHDLECPKCSKKVKKILCKFPQIQDQVYDEKNNTVRIKVLCCCPEKIRDKICCKGKGTIKIIEILKPPETPSPKQGGKESSKRKDSQEDSNPPPTNGKGSTTNGKGSTTNDKGSTTKEGNRKSTEKKPEKTKTPEVKIKDKNIIEINFFDVPKPCYCGRNCNGYCGTGGPVYCSCGCGGYRSNCGRPVCSCGCGGYGGNCVRPVYCSCGCGGYRVNCGRPVHCSCGCGGYRDNCGSRCSQYYFIEDNSQGCTIM